MERFRFTENRQIDPIKAVPKTGAPDYVLDFEHALVLEHGQAIAHADDAANSLDGSARKMLRLHSDERQAVREQRLLASIG